MSLSWLLGNRGASNGAGDDSDKSNSSSSFSGAEDSPDKKQQKVNFDASALERAATAAKYLEGSKHARDAFELARLEEQTKQQEIVKHTKAIEAQKEQLRLEQAKTTGEERRKTIAEETKQHQQRAQYEDHLSRKRHEDQIARNAQVQEETLKKQEESIARQEALKRQTMQYKSNLKQKAEENSIRNKYKAKAEVERENFDIRLSQIKAQGEESRKTVLESLQTVSSVMGQGISTLLQNPSKLAMVAGGTALISLGIYSAKSGTATFFRIVEKRVSVPSLVRETSRKSAISAFKNPWKSVSRVLSSKDQEILDKIIFSPNLESKLRDVAIATKFTKRNGGYFRNILFAGPPGTGKTLFAKNLAHHSGLHYAILSGGDITPLGADAVTAIHRVFDWAETSKRGTLIFIDESDAFLKKRQSDADSHGTSGISEHLRSALNAFLYRTGTQSRNTMLVLASNEPEQLDWAASDRVDEVIHFPLPGLTERKRILMMYIEDFILSKLHNKTSSNMLLTFISTCKRLIWPELGRMGLDDSLNLKKLVDDLALKTEGFTGREISKLVVSMQAAALSSENGILTQSLIELCLESAVFSHSQKQKWLSNYEKVTFGSVKSPSSTVNSSNSSSKFQKESTEKVILKPNSSTGAKNSVKC